MFNKIMYKLFSNVKRVYEIKPKFKYYNEIVTKTTEEGVYVLHGMSGDRFIPWNNVVPSWIVFTLVCSILWVSTYYLS